MNRSEALALVAAAPVARLATVRDDNAPHIVPVTFALLDEDTLVTMVDHKPKTTTRLQRLANIEANPLVSLLADHYETDWERLWWVRVDGTATVHHDGHLWEAARAALVAKYRQYRPHPPQGPAIEIEINSVAHWASTQ